MIAHIERDIFSQTRDLLVPALREHVGPQLRLAHNAVIEAWEKGEGMDFQTATKNTRTNEEITKSDLTVDGRMRNIWQPSILGHIPWYSEESKAASLKRLKPEELRKVPLMLLVDPIDGSGIISHGFDEFTSAYTLISYGVPIFTIVYKPEDKRGEIIWIAERDGESREYVYKPIHPEMSDKEKKVALNSAPEKDIKLHVRPTATLDKAYMSTAYAWYLGQRIDSHDRMRRVLHYINQAREHAASIYDIALVGRGWMDGHISDGLKPHDIGPALLVVQSGGRVSQFSKPDQEWHVFQEEILATNGLIHDETQRILNRNIIVNGLGQIYQRRTRKDIHAERGWKYRTAKKVTEAVVFLAKKANSQE